MSDPAQQQQQDTAGGNQPDPAAVVARPDWLPETIWDGEKNAPKIDLAASLTELDTLRPLKTAADERAAKIPGKPEDYKFELPADFQLPEGTKFEARADDPLVQAVREYAVANRLTQDELGGLVTTYAKVKAAEIKAETENQAKFAAEQTAALGANAEARRTAAKTWIDANLSKEEASVYATLLDLKVGVEAVEKIIAKASGTVVRGQPGATKENPNKNLADKIGTPGHKAMDTFNAAAAA